MGRTLTDPRPVATFADLDLQCLDCFAAMLVHLLPTGLVVGLVGTLGAGKTRLTQAIASEFEIDPADVTSPTFTLLQTHAGSHPSGQPLTLHHLDAYRLVDEDEFLELGVEELFEASASAPQPAWTIVEWADRVADVMPRNTLWLNLTVQPQQAPGVSQHPGISQHPGNSQNSGGLQQNVSDTSLRRIDVFCHDGDLIEAMELVAEQFAALVSPDVPVE